MTQALCLLKHPDLFSIAEQRELWWRVSGSKNFTVTWKEKPDGVL
jgi:hypothetical protein